MADPGDHFEVTIWLKAAVKTSNPIFNLQRIIAYDSFTDKRPLRTMQNVCDYRAAISMLLTPSKSELLCWKNKWGDRYKIGG